MSQSTHTGEPRYHGLDWLRAGAALAVVALHAGIAYTVQPFPGLAWPVHDPSPSVMVDALTWWIDAWVMPVFFVMSGLLAAQLFERLAPMEYLKHRARRLLVPLAFGCVAILPADLYVWLLGWVVEERIPLKKLRSLKLGDAGAGLWGVGHLWFLEYLFVFCVAALGVHALQTRVRRGRRWLPASDHQNSQLVHTVPPRPSLREGRATRGLRILLTIDKRGVIVAGFACSAMALWWAPAIVIGFRHAWHPLPANLLYYGPFFAVGWWLLYHRGEDDRAEPVAFAGLALSSLLFAAALPLIHDHASNGSAGAERFALTVLFAGCGWSMALAVVRLSLMPCASPPRAVRYVAEASLWVYLIHHPVVGLAQVALHGSGLPAGAKYVLVLASGVALSLLTYEGLVRRTWIGALLNGRREMRDARSTDSVGSRATPARRAA